MIETIKVNNIVGQYRSVVGALGIMFTEMDLRSEINWWRADGVGSCRTMDKQSSEDGLIGPSKGVLIALREKRNIQNPGNKSPLTDCPYHREEYGCVLGDLKSPYCIAHVDRPSTLKRNLRINGYALREDIYLILSTILTQGSIVGLGSPEQFYLNALEAIFDITAYVKTQPILERQDRPFLSWMMESRQQGY